MRHLTRTLVTLLPCLLTLAPLAHADGDGSSPPLQGVDDGGWEVRATSYGWLTWLDGSSVIRNRSFDVDVTPGDVLDALDFAVMGTLEARKERWSVWADLVYADLSGSKDVLVALPGGGLSGPISSSLRMTTLEAAVAMSLQQDTGNIIAWPQHMSADVYVGARYWNQRASAEAQLSATTDLSGLEIAGSRVIARSGTVDWVDPIVGLRLRADLPSGGEVFLRGDIGGFGAGSDFSWQLFGAWSSLICADRDVTWSSYLGYRALSVDYSQGSARTATSTMSRNMVPCWA